MILAVGDIVDVIDKRDNTVIERGVMINSLYEGDVPGSDAKKMFASLSTGYAVPIGCLRHSTTE